MKNKPVLKVGFTGILALCISQNAFGDEQNILGPAMACRQIEDTSEKVKCYDNAIEQLAELNTNGKIVVITSKTLQSIEEESFGFELPKLSIFDLPKADIPPKTKMIHSEVIDAQRFLTGFVFTLKNGQVWEQYSDEISHIPPGALTANIRIMNSGSYRMSLSNGKHRVKNIKVRRIS